MFEIAVKVPVWNIEAVCGYKPITTFWNDFSVADAFGTSAVVDTFKRAFEEWKGNYKFLTELVMVLNHKIWQWFEKNSTLAAIYNRFLRHNQIFEQFFVLINTKEVFWNIQALQYR